MLNAANRNPFRSMDPKRLDELITQVENYLECWKQFNQCVVLARGKKFSQEDESQFLELKSVLTQELEMILASFAEGNSPTKEEVITLVSSSPSLRYLSEQTETTLRQLENEWHKIYIGWQSILGQLKVQQRQAPAKSSFWSAVFGRKKEG
jgi:hypothetical protein